MPNFLRRANRHPMVQRDKCRGMRGYSGNAAELIARYEAVPFSRKHEALIALIPPGCSRALDVGAGAEESGLHAILDLRRVSAQEANRAAGVTWSQLAFVRAGTEDFLMKEFSGAPAHANR